MCHGLASSLLMAFVKHFIVTVSSFTMDFHTFLQDLDNLLDFAEHTEHKLRDASMDDIVHIAEAFQVSLTVIDILVNENNQEPLEANKLDVLIRIRGNLHELCPVWNGYLETKAQQQVICPRDSSGCRGRPPYILQEEQVLINKIMQT